MDTREEANSKAQKEVSLSFKPLMRQQSFENNNEQKETLYIFHCEPL